MGYKIIFASRADKIFYKLDRRNNLENQNYKCYYCGGELTRDTATTDHVIPLSKTNRCHDPKNTVASCESCNSIKGDQELVIDHFDIMLKNIVKRLEERTKLAEWRLSFDHKGSFRKWKRYHEKQGQKE